MLIAVRNLERVKVRNTGAKCLVKDVVAALEAGGVLLPSVVRFAPFPKTLHYGLGGWPRRLVAYSTADRVQDFAKTGSGNFQVPSGNVLVDFIRRSLEPNHG